jgi:hypothetical protein
MVFFNEQSTQTTTFERKYDSDGKVWIQSVAHANLTAKTGYKVIVNEFGQITAAQADDQNYYYLAFPEAAVTSGDAAWLQIGGYIEDMVTPTLSVALGHALKMHDGAIADTGADYSGAAGEFAACSEASTSSATQKAMLVPERIIGTT